MGGPSVEGAFADVVWQPESNRIEDDAAKICRGEPLIAINPLFV